MAGIYVHIPFCRAKCFYCGFYSVASLQWREDYAEALCREMDLRADYLPGKEVATLYFGGGTPSCLEEAELKKIVSHIHKGWKLEEGAECTIEVNPEDVVPDKLGLWKDLGFNRLSIGVQSFEDRVLERIHRRHTGEQAMQAVLQAKRAGFSNINMDLIIGLPGMDREALDFSLRMAGELGVTHVSAYMLSLDAGSVLEKLYEQGKFQPMDDDALAEHYLYVSDILGKEGYDHYEISNFAKDAKYARHNTAYWTQQPYIGLGAAAHSFDGISRQWNVAHVKKYMKALSEGKVDFEREILTDRDKYNEYLMTRFRTKWGIDTAYMTMAFPAWWEKAEQRLRGYERQGWIAREEGRVRMTKTGWLVSDMIFSELFV